MQVFERIGRILRADAHGVMDRLEERSSMLKQHLREAELEVAHKRARLAALEAERGRLAEAGRRLEAEVAKLDDDVELARRGEDADLARFAVRRLLPRREELREVFAEAARIEQRREALEEVLARQESQLAALRPRVRAALARPEREGPGWNVGDAVSDEEVDLELLRRREGDVARAARHEEGGR